MSRARGVGIGSKPFAVKACPSGLIADGATGAFPPGWNKIRDASDMPELADDGTAGDMDRLRHAFPAGDLLGAVDAGVEI